MEIDEKASHELLISLFLFTLIWIVSTTENQLQSFSMSIVLFLVGIIVFFRILTTISNKEVIAKGTVLARNSDLLVFSFLGILSGIIHISANPNQNAKDILWLISLVMAGGMAIRLMLSYNFLRSFERKTTKEGVEWSTSKAF